MEYWDGDEVVREDGSAPVMMTGPDSEFSPVWSSSSSQLGWEKKREVWNKMRKVMAGDGEWSRTTMLTPGLTLS